MEMQEKAAYSVMGPSLRLNETDLPEVKNWKVGQTYTLELKVKQTESHLDPDGSICAEFQIIKAKNNKDY